MSDSPNNPAPGANTVIAGRYRLDKHRAHGGMADVWMATDLSLNRTVAVKLLKPHLATEGTVAERFRREALVAAGLNDPHVVTVHDAVEDNGRQAVIMEFVDGKSLRETLDKQGTLSLKLTVHIGLSVCAALEAAHRAGIIHRDVKPGNILLTENGRVMLTDFGIAKALSGDQDLTNENIMMGTAKYLSPEQVDGDELGPAADIYSLGLVLYECLAGRVPFIGSSDTETALARLKKEPTPLSTLKPDLDPAVLDVIHRMLVRRPEARIRSGAEAIRALKAASGNTTPSAPTRAKDPTPNKVIRSKTGGTPSNGTPRDAASGAAVKRTRPRTRVPLVALGVGIVGVLAVILAITAGGDSSSNTPAPTTTAVPTTVYNGPISITGVKAFDPESDDKTENDDQAGNVTDGDPDTTWSTVCYKSSTFGGKSGVGLVLQLNASALAQIEVDMNVPEWQARIYAANTAGETLADWGAPLWDGSSEQGSTVVATFTAPAQYALVYFTEGGRSGFCSDVNPYRGSISEIRIQPAP
jgi:serine/threonine-protein kinase